MISFSWGPFLVDVNVNTWSQVPCDSSVHTLRGSCLQVHCVKGLRHQSCRERRKPRTGQAVDSVPSHVSGMPFLPLQGRSGRGRGLSCWLSWTVWGQTYMSHASMGLWCLQSSCCRSRVGGYPEAVLTVSSGQKVAVCVCVMVCGGLGLLFLHNSILSHQGFFPFVNPLLKM